MACPTVPRRMYLHADDPLCGDVDTSTPEPAATAQNETAGQDTCPKEYPGDGATSSVQCAEVGSVVT